MFFRPSFNFFADKLIFRTTKKRKLSPTNSLEFETKLSESPLIIIERKRGPRIEP